MAVGIGLVFGADTVKITTADGRSEVDEGPFPGVVFNRAIFAGADADLADRIIIRPADWRIWQTILVSFATPKGTARKTVKEPNATIILQINDL